MAEHTTGPWHVIPTLTGALSINGAPKVPIATVGGAGWHLGEDTARANARLIAAAPDMLAALKALEIDSIGRRLEIIREAITKATKGG